MTDWTVGQTVWVQAGNERWLRSGERTVTKVGRVWVTLDDGLRFSKETGGVDYSVGSSPGRAFPSQADAEREACADEAWRELVSKIRYVNKPRGLPEAAIREAGRLLGLWG